jgi:HAE1 family hydrophobic/amphiphilic exporter-1
MIASLIDRLTRASLRFKWTVLALVLVALVTGVVALTHLNQELIPSMEFPANVVLAPNNGATVEQMRDQVTIPIEKAVRGIAGVVNVQSTTTDGLTYVVIMNEFGLDQGPFRSKIRSALESIAFPTGMQAPRMLAFAIDDLPIVSAGVSADRPLADLKTLVESSVVPVLKQAAGIADVQITGGQELPAASAAGQQPAAQPTAVPAGGGSPLPAMWQAAGKAQGVKLDVAGDVTPAMMQTIVQMSPQMLDLLTPQNLLDFSPQVLAALPPSYFAKLDAQTLAALQQKAAGAPKAFIPESTIATVDGNPALLLKIYKDRAANTVTASHALYDKMDELKAAYPGLRFDVTFEQSSFIEESINGVTREGLLGALFAVIAILLFLSGRIGSHYKLAWRSALVTGISIPLSVLMAFALLRWLPPAADLVLAPLVDATHGIPFIGAFFALLQRLFPTSFTLNIITLSGMTVAVGRVVDDSIVVQENIYRHLQLGEDRRSAVLTGVREVSIPILASTVTTIVVFLPIGLVGGMVGQFFLPFGVTVAFALASSFLVAVTVVPLLTYLFIRKEDLPAAKETTLQRWYTAALNWSLARRAVVLVVAGVLFVGSLALMGQQPRAILPDMGEPQITVAAKLPDGTDMAVTAARVAEFEQSLKGIEGLGVIQSQIGSAGGAMAMAARMFGMGGGGIDQTQATSTIGVKDAKQVDALTAIVRQKAEQAFGRDDSTVSGGALMSSAMSNFSLILSGDPDTVAAINAQVIATLEDIPGLVNVSSNLAGESVLLRVNGQPAVEYTADVESRDSMGMASQARVKVQSILPAGVTASEGFASAQQTQAFSDAILGVLISIIAVYVVMVITFGSLLHPFIILFSLPLAAIGAGLALWITDGVVGLPVLVGLMMLVGIVVTNAIVLIDRVNTNRKERGMSTRDALVEGGRTRLRPILMTAVATILALVPLAISTGGGAIIASDLAKVVIGGLLTSTLLTLVVVPVVYSLLNRQGAVGRK